MTDTSGTTNTVRRLLLNGEGLRIDVEAAPSGGGPKYEPFTAEQAREWLLPQIRSMRSTLTALPGTLRAGTHVYIEAKLLPNYIAPTYSPEALLAFIGAVPVGSRADAGELRTATKVQRSGTRRLILAVDEIGLARLEDLVDTGGSGRSAAQAFAQIRRLEDVSSPNAATVLRGTPPTADIEAGADDEMLWESVLHPRTVHSGEPVPIDQDSLERWIALVEASHGTVHRDFLRQVGGLTFLPVRAPRAAAQALARFNPLRVLRPMPAIRPRPRFGLRSGARLSPPPAAGTVGQVTTIAVFDGGIDDPAHAGLFPIVRTDLTPEPPDPDDLVHGTGVTGAVLYGRVGQGQQAPQPPLPVESYRVMPAPYVPGDLDGYWILDRIKEALANDRHKLVNLSLGPTLAVEDDVEPNRWTAELDQLAWERDIVFVVAAGNDGGEDQQTGLHRVQVPADMANAVSVGACDAPAPLRPWGRAPYSSMGPGRPGNRVQPLGVQFGGVDSSMFDVLRADGSFLEASGTSFSAPLVTHALADLATRLPRVNSSVMRAFAVHFAERHRAYRAKQNEFGFGRLPLSFADALDCTPDDVHVLYVDQIVRGDILGYQVPMPRGFTGAAKIIVTLAYASPVEPTQPTEYTSASLELTLRPNRNIFRFSPPPGSTTPSQHVDLRSADARTLLTGGWTASQEPVTKTLTGSTSRDEADLRDAGKWETLRHHRVSFAADEADDPRLEVRYVARRAGALAAAPTDVPFAILISVTDTEHTGALYDAVTAQFAALRPVQRVSGRVRLRGARPTTWY
ncbi:S8 family peptidase [Curtobacterium sp. PhB136]|uniref:S8 family peptidase n=1 Tax=Curtobacterium sp. PhB136 TaxID=2485181 RepID=UPI001051A2EA|nr:S8 family peptidase [Curtobacterium sp. PhB136]TCK58323.1 subtilase family protein [Curtobacterium sp. PhB136]